MEVDHTSFELFSPQINDHRGRPRTQLEAQRLPYLDDRINNEQRPADKAGPSSNSKIDERLYLIKQVTNLAAAFVCGARSGIHQRR